MVLPISAKRCWVIDHMCGPDGVNISLNEKAEPFSDGKYDTAERSAMAEDDRRREDKADGAGIMTVDPKKVLPPAMRTLLV